MNAYVLLGKTVLKLFVAVTCMKYSFSRFPLFTFLRHVNTWNRAPLEWTDHLFLNLTNTSSRETIIMASSSANGIVKIWSIALTGSTIQKTQCVATIDHGSSLEEENIPQVYALQFITHWMGANACTNHHNLLLTSADDELHLWEVINEVTNLTTLDDSKTSSANKREDSSRICYRRMLSYRFVCIENGNGGVILNIGSEDEDNQSFSDLIVSPGLQNKFGGERNPKGLIFVFDASHCKSNGFLAVGKFLVLLRKFKSNDNFL
jgi:WD40 repeat protein